MKTKQGREIRMAVFDLDGTLLTTDKRISDADRAAVRFLTDGGVKVVTASGRFPLTAAEMTAQLGLGLEDDLYIADGGGTICRAGKALRKINPMDREVYSTTTAASKALGFAPYAAAGDRVYFDSEGPLDEIYGTLNERSPGLVQKVDRLEECEDVFKLIYRIWNEEDFAKLKALETPDILVFRSSEYMAEITNSRLGKWNALESLMRSEAIDPENVLAVGDSGNDADMLRGAGIGAAMKNALPEAAEAADLIGEYTSDESGVAGIVYELFENAPSRF